MSEKEDLVRNFPACLWVYPSEKKGPKEEKITRITFLLAFISVGLFSVTRLFLIHWVWLIPVSLGFLTLLAITLVALKFREKPLYGIRVTSKGVRIETPPWNKDGGSHYFPLKEVTAQRLSVEGSPPESFSLFFEGRPLCECSLFRIRNVSLYQQIFEYFTLPGDERPDIFPDEETKPGKKLSWFLLSYGLIALLLSLWAIYQLPHR